MSTLQSLDATGVKVQFAGHSGEMLAARLDIPAGQVRATAIFAHCFTCSKDLLAAREVAGELARMGLAVLRFDFTGLGSSKGEFAHTNFSSNIEDLLIAASYLRDNYQAPSLIIGHSLGGAAVLAAAGDIPEVKAVATIGAPSDTEHVLHNFDSSIDKIEKDGVAEVNLAGRKFTIEKQFVDDVRGTKLKERIATMKKALLVLHSPIDKNVGVENAANIFMAAKHPKSFVSLDNADHLVTKAEDASYAARVIASWVERYLPPLEVETSTSDASTPVVRVTESMEGKFQQVVQAGRHRLFADEPVDYGGYDSGPTPYDFLATALGACTGMTLRLYAAKKKLDLGRISVEVSHSKVHASDCDDCGAELQGEDRKIDRFERVITISGGYDKSLEQKLLEIADKCPVHKTLEATGLVATSMADTD